MKFSLSTVLFIQTVSVHHMLKTAAKVRTRNNLINKLAGSTWGARASTLRTAILALAVFLGGWVLCSHLVPQYSHETRWQPAQFSNADDLGFNHVDPSPVASSSAKYSASLSPPKFSFWQRTKSGYIQIYQYLKTFTNHLSFDCHQTSDMVYNAQFWLCSRRRLERRLVQDDVPNQFLRTDPTIRQPGFDLNRSDWTIAYSTGIALAMAVVQLLCVTGAWDDSVLCEWRQTEWQHSEWEIRSAERGVCPIVTLNITS